MAQPLHQIMPIPGRGNGMVATRDISKGTMILQEDPLLVIDTGIPHANWDANVFYENERTTKSSRISAALARTSRANRLIFEAAGGLYEGNVPVPAPATYIRNINRVSYNAWSFEHEAVNYNQWLTVANAMSHINHSCSPNARILDVCRDEGSLGQQRLVSTADIPAGGEIVVEYMVHGDGFWLEKRSVRRPSLQAGWGFTCMCKACDPRNYKFADKDYSHAKSLKATVLSEIPAADDTFMVSMRIHAAEAYIDILNFWGYCDRRLSKAYMALCELYVMTEKYAEAREAAVTGLTIEGYYFDHDEKICGKLQWILAQCAGKLS